MQPGNRMPKSSQASKRAAGRMLRSSESTSVRCVSEEEKPSKLQEEAFVADKTACMAAVRPKLAAACRATQYSSKLLIRQAGKRTHFLNLKHQKLMIKFQAVLRSHSGNPFGRAPVRIVDVFSHAETGPLLGVDTTR